MAALASRNAESCDDLRPLLTTQGINIRVSAQERRGASRTRLGLEDRRPAYNAMSHVSFYMRRAASGPRS